MRQRSSDEECAPLLSCSEQQPAENGTTYGSCGSQDNAEASNNTKSSKGPSGAKSAHAEDDPDPSVGKKMGIWLILDNAKVVTAPPPLFIFCPMSFGLTEAASASYRSFGPPIARGYSLPTWASR
jgi:hypothetical protein